LPKVVSATHPSTRDHDLPLLLLLLPPPSLADLDPDALANVFGFLN
jgi:hypothetical protein